MMAELLLCPAPPAARGVEWGAAPHSASTLFGDDNNLSFDGKHTFLYWKEKWQTDNNGMMQPQCNRACYGTACCRRCVWGGKVNKISTNKKKGPLFCKPKERILCATIRC
jgi:hypothetical protein